MKNNNSKLKTTKNDKFFRFYFLDFILSRKTNGFTLIELLVALGVFMVVMTITMSAFLNVMDIQKKAEAFRKVNDNLNFAMEAMMRETREGTDYCSGGCASGSFIFKNKTGESVTYKLNDSNSNDKYIERKTLNNQQRMTSDGINITRLSFLVKGNGFQDKKQPLVTIFIRGTSGIREKWKSDLHLQATVSQRKLDPQ